MVGYSPTAPVNPTGQLAHNIPGYDPSQVIAAQEQSLQDYLNLPAKEILERLGLPQAATGSPADGVLPTEAHPDAAQAHPMDPGALISPVTNALSSLGPGLFNGADPTAMLQGVSQTFQSTGGQLTQSLGSLNDAWRGTSGSAAAAKTANAIANGAQVGAQSDALRAGLTTAASNVAQARARVIEIITEFQATLAAIGPNIIFPWGWAAAIAAANKAIGSTAEVMTETQASLGAQAAKATTDGAPVAVTAAPQTASSSLVASLASPLMSVATRGAMAGMQAGTSAASGASQSAAKPPSDTDARRGAVGAMPAGARASSGHGGSPVGGAGLLPPRSMATSAVVQPETASTSTQSATVRASNGTVGTNSAGMGTPYAPMAGQAGKGASTSHSAAAFLHTTDQGDEIVGNLGTAALPVLGEADPNEPADVELRI